MIWNGINVSVFGPVITLRKPKNFTFAVYSGYDEVGYYDASTIDIPLDIRYQDFCQRLANRLKRYNVT